jgi:hypothetical protein
MNPLDFVKLYNEKFGPSLERTVIDKRKKIGEEAGILKPLQLSRFRRWTAGEEKFILDNASLPFLELTDAYNNIFPHRSDYAIALRLRELKRVESLEWSKEELELMEELKQKLFTTMDDLVESFLENYDRPIEEIKAKAKGAYITHVKHGKHYKWTEIELDYLKRIIKKYGYMNLETVAERMQSFNFPQRTLSAYQKRIEAAGYFSSSTPEPEKVKTTRVDPPKVALGDDDV